MLNDFYVKTTVVFYVSIAVDGVAPSLVEDTVSFIMKKNINDTDEEAVIFVNSTPTATEGKVKFTLSASATDVTARSYVYEIKWVSGEVVTILESGSVAVNKRVFD